MTNGPLVPLDELAEKYRDILIKGSTARLTAAEEIDYCVGVCRSLGMNPLTNPIMFIDLPARQGQEQKRVPYANRNGAEQLRKIYGVSVSIVGQEMVEGRLHVHAKATLPDGRTDEDYGVVPFPKTGNPEWLSNRYMTAVTKAKRRVTLSICGLGFLDETEIESIYAEAGKKMPEPSGMEDMLARERTAEAIARDPDPRPPTASQRLRETYANGARVKQTEDDPRTMPTMPEDWDKRMGRGREPGEEG